MAKYYFHLAFIMVITPDDHGGRTRIMEGILMRQKGHITTNLGIETEKRIEELVRKGCFKSRDDFIELACHEFVIRRSPPIAIPDDLQQALIPESCGRNI